jgi:hypothetical protein
MFAPCLTRHEEKTTVTRTWRDVPDPRDAACPAGPRCEVLLEDRLWSHLDKHVRDRTQHWDYWLTPSLATDLRNSLQPGMSEERRQKIRDQASGLMEDAAKQATGVPLAVLYDVAQPPRGQGQGSRWALTVDLVLPCGAKLCLREDRHKVLGVLTCYFITAVRSAPPDQRWRLLVKHLLQRFARDNGNGTFSSPDRSRPRASAETGEWVNNPRFRTEARWGIEPASADPLDNLPHCWPPPATPAGPATTLDLPYGY